MNFNIWFVFLGASLLNSLLPGPGAIITVNQALQQGWRKTIALIAGQATALALMVPLVELSAEILRATPTAWLLLKIISILWLIFAAYKIWRSPIMIDVYDIVNLTSRKQSFSRGFLTNITNAKSFVFLLAILPVFVNPAQSLTQQIGIMTLTIVAVDTIIMTLYAFIAGRLRPYFQSTTTIQWQNLLFAGFLLLMAISVCFVDLTD